MTLLEQFQQVDNAGYVIHRRDEVAHLTNMPRGLTERIASGGLSGAGTYFIYDSKRPREGLLFVGGFETCIETALDDIMLQQQAA